MFDYPFRKFFTQHHNLFLLIYTHTWSFLYLSLLLDYSTLFIDPKHHLTNMALLQRVTPI